MKQQSSATSPPSNSDGYASEYVIVQGLQTTMPPSRSKPPRRPGCFPVTFTVLLVHPNPNRKVSHYDLVRYKTSYELWVNCDDFSCFESGVAAVNWLVDLMNVPFPLQDVQLFWKTNVGFELPVVNWNCMLLLLALLLRDVKNLVRKQEDDNSDERYPYVKLQISKFVKLSKEGLEAARRAAQSGRANGEWVERTLRRPQREMEWRMVVLQSQAIERVKLEGGGQGEEESCGICLIDMCVGSEVARLPCSHYTHERCILRWLMTNNSCPFCRFKIAAIEGKTRPTPDHYWSTPCQHNSISTPAT